LAGIPSGGEAISSLQSIRRECRLKPCRRTDVDPENDHVYAGVLDHLKLMREVGIAAHELLFDYNWMAMAARRIFGFANSRTTVAVVDA
jgi:hypothetical protein